MAINLSSIFSRWASVFCWLSGLVNESATFFVELTLYTSINFFLRHLWIRWNCPSMCLDFWWDLSSLTNAMAPLLLQKSRMASDRITPSSTTNFLNQNPFFAASDAAIYFASIVESIMISYLKLFQLTTPLLHKNTKHDIDFLSSMSDMKFEFVYPCTH